MKRECQKTRQSGQTLVFFMVSFATVWLLCGLGIDSGLLYLSQARLSRACDAAVISGVQNFSRPQAEVAGIMRNVAAANYVDLMKTSQTPTSVVTNDLGGGRRDVIYTFINPSPANSNYVETFTATLSQGAGGQITKAAADAEVRHRTVFMAYTGVEHLKNLKLEGQAQAIRRPRLIDLVLDRSGSMTSGSNKGSTNLAVAVTNFIQNFFPGQDEIGIVTYSSFGRNDMPLTTNFIFEGTNKMAYAMMHPQRTNNPSGVKFSGYTAADEGMREAYESMRKSDGFKNAETIKYLVFFTDGEFNSTRGLWASPGLTNVIIGATNGVHSSRLANGLSAGFKGPLFMFTSSTSSNAELESNDTDNGPAYGPRIVTNFATNGGDSSGWRFYTNMKLYMPPGSAFYQYTESGLSVIWSRHTNSTTNVSIPQRSTNFMVFPGYIVDGVAIPNYINFPNSGSITNEVEHYIRRNLDAQQFIVTQPHPYEMENGTTPLTNALPVGDSYYPSGRCFWNDNDYVVSSSSDYYGNIQITSTNMGTSYPHWAGGTFFGLSGGQLTTYQEWTTNAPSWVTGAFRRVMHMQSNVSYPTEVMWRPTSYNGEPWQTVHSAMSFVSPTPLAALSNLMTVNYTGGGMILPDGAGGYTTNINTMTYISRPIWCFNFEHGEWRLAPSNGSALADITNKKVLDYCERLRQEDVTIFTVSFLPSSTFTSRQSLFYGMSNDRRWANFNPVQPEGESYNVTTPSQLKDVFQQIADKITAVLTE